MCSVAINWSNRHQGKRQSTTITCRHKWTRQTWPTWINLPPTKKVKMSGLMISLLTWPPQTHHTTQQSSPQLKIGQVEQCRKKMRCYSSNKKFSHFKKVINSIDQFRNCQMRSQKKQIPEHIYLITSQLPEHSVRSVKSQPSSNQCVARAKWSTLIRSCRWRLNKLTT